MPKLLWRSKGGGGAVSYKRGTPAVMPLVVKQMYARELLARLRRVVLRRQHLSAPALRMRRQSPAMPQNLEGM